MFNVILYYIDGHRSYLDNIRDIFTDKRNMLYIKQETPFGAAMTHEIKPSEIKNISIYELEDEEDGKPEKLWK